ncbi:hypothetical protein FE394_09880 [Xenorhabdus sp. Reich]|uniref:Uncharacterized protein n=1 Tax=Xenorhabdus littoralis TaxID=2582835 RepID=A0ABU4SLJ4_9GAMM|nr:hypothetical protein [Xenorhabdus sp. Reich]MDX7999503.1 hypothetical protein [Xenorhabdus sp. Reich]
MNDFFLFNQTHYINNLKENKIINDFSFKPGRGFCYGISLYLLKKIINETCQCHYTLLPHCCDYIYGERNFKFPSLQEVFDIAKKHSEIIHNSGLNALSSECFNFNTNMLFIQKKACKSPFPGYFFNDNEFPDEGCVLVLLSTMDYEKTAETHIGSLFYNNYKDLASSKNNLLLNHAGFAFWNKENLFVFDPNTGGKLEKIRKFTPDAIEIAINSMYFRINSHKRIRIMCFYFPNFNDRDNKHLNNIIEQM